jgi:hypothetical protein
MTAMFLFLAANSTFPICGVLFFADSLMVKDSSMLRINICAKKSAHGKSNQL